MRATQAFNAGSENISAPPVKTKTPELPSRIGIINFSEPFLHVLCTSRIRSQQPMRCSFPTDHAPCSLSNFYHSHNM